MWLLWWSPSILVGLGLLLLDRLRFRLVLGFGAVLREVGAIGLARRMYRAEMRRCERRALLGR